MLSRAVLAAATAALFAVLSLAPAGAQSRITEPAILSDADVDLYRQIFEVQERGDWTTADRLIARLSNPVLMGHVQFQRYMHPTAYRSRFNELNDWMDDYADLPEAGRVYRLAERRRPDGTRAVRSPEVRRWRVVAQPIDPFDRYLPSFPTGRS